jgi:hypothetical protein
MATWQQKSAAAIARYYIRCMQSLWSKQSSLSDVSPTVNKMNHIIFNRLSAAIGISIAITIGWTETGSQLCRHGHRNPHQTQPTQTPIKLLNFSSRMPDVRLVSADVTCCLFLHLEMHSLMIHFGVRIF